jgi:hypothetical protein
MYLTGVRQQNINNLEISVTKVKILVFKEKSHIGARRIEIYNYKTIDQVKIFK